MTTRPTVPLVLEQHLEDTIALRSTRSVLVRAPHVRMLHLRRIDERIAAHLDGLAVASDAGREACSAALARLGRGSMFTAGVLAIESRDGAVMDKLLSLCPAAPEAAAGLRSAFGWVSSAALGGLIKPLLDADDEVRRDIGLAACAMHGVNPGPVLEKMLAAAPASRRALATAGRLGASSLLPHALAALGAEDDTTRFEAARSALLLGDRDASVNALGAIASRPGPATAAALDLVLKVLALDRAHALLKPLSQAPQSIRALIRGTGAVGDPFFVAWLIRQMADLKLARIAAEAFSTITGADLARLDLEAKPPEGEVFGPNDDPADADVAMDEDDGLPWPDTTKVSAWWQANGARFQSGTRYFVGEPPSVAHCLSVLKIGFQRQRIAAAEYLCLLQPGTPLFNVAAPAWRQDRQLAKLGT